MNRREAFLVASSSLASTALAHTFGTAVSGCGAQSSPGGTTPPAAAHDELASLVAACLAACEACHAHCLASLATGDTMMAACSRTTFECAALCRAMITLASTDSEHLRGLAAVCAAACGDCHDACAPHAAHHPTCARCADACERCGAACHAIVA